MYGNVVCSKWCDFLSLVLANIKICKDKHEKFEYEQGRVTKMKCKQNQKKMVASKCMYFQWKYNKNENQEETNKCGDPKMRIFPGEI